VFAKVSCLSEDTQEILLLMSRALFRAGNNIDAKIAIIAIVMSSSIKVNFLLAKNLCFAFVAFGI